MTTRAELFRALHHGGTPLVLPNAWDPVSARLVAEAGGLPAKEFAERLLETGAVGCNLEDAVDGKLVDPAQQADYLAEVRAVAGADLVINARIDNFLFSGDVADAISRGREYRRAGADCTYPILAPLEVLPALVTGIGGPVNAHATPAGPTAAELAAVGVRRISYGTSVHKHLMDALRQLLPSLA